MLEGSPREAAANPAGPGYSGSTHGGSLTPSTAISPSVMESLEENARRPAVRRSSVLRQGRLPSERRSDNRYLAVIFRRQIYTEPRGADHPRASVALDR